MRLFHLLIFVTALFSRLLSSAQANEALLLAPHDTTTYAIEKDGQWISSVLDKRPAYAYGMKEFYKTLRIKIVFPQDAKDKMIVGKINVLFEVDTLGRAGNFKIMNDIKGKCGEAAIDALVKVANWKIAVKDGKKYKSRFNLPMRFAIVRENETITTRKKKIVPEEIPTAKTLEEVVVIGYVSGEPVTNHRIN